MHSAAGINAGDTTLKSDWTGILSLHLDVSKW